MKRNLFQALADLLAHRRTVPHGGQNAAFPQETLPKVSAVPRTLGLEASRADTAGASSTDGKPPEQVRPCPRRPQRLTRHGIRRLEPNEDPAACFRETVETPVPHRTAPVARAAQRPAGGRKHGPLTNPRVRAADRNRHGIRSLDARFDLEAHFCAKAPPSAARSAEEGCPAADPAPRHGVKRPSVDRHGIPQLDRDTDLLQHFSAAARCDDGSDALAELLRQSLGDGRGAVMRRKTSGISPARKSSLKETLRRYPSPQAQLDLHGLTARQAQLRVERFVRAARADGLFTLRIIVGRGLHSEAGAVLPDVAEDLLVELKHQGLILSFAWDRRIKKKSGALLVYLDSTPP